MSTLKKSAADETAYHHGNLREALVSEGLTLLEEGGVAGFSLRELARRVGVSANAAYRHFDNKDALLGAVAAEGFRRFATGQLQAAQGHANAMEAFLASGKAYVEFARRHPELFRLMFGRFGADSRSEEMAAASQVAFEGLRHGVAAALERPVDDATIEVAALHAWSLVHGLSHLVLDGQLQRRGQKAEDVVEAVLRQAMAMGAGMREGRQKEER